MTMSVPSSVQVALIQVSSAGNCSVLLEKHVTEIASIRQKTSVWEIQSGLGGRDRFVLRCLSKRSSRHPVKGAGHVYRLGSGDFL